MDPTVVGLFGFAAWLAFAVFIRTARQFRAVQADSPWVASWSASIGDGNGSPPARRPRRPCSTDPALPLTIEAIVEHRAVIERHLKSRGVRGADLDDLTALVIEGAWRSRASWSPKLSSFDTFLWAICRNIAVTHAGRAYQRRVDVVDPCADVFLMVEADETPESALERAEQHVEVARARAIIAKLSARLAAVFTPYEVDGVPMVDVAATLGINLSTAWGRLQSARVVVARLVAKARALEGRRRRAPRPR